MNRLRFPLLLPFVVWVGACGSEEVQPTPDAGSQVQEDMGVVVETDSGVRTKCPIPENNPSCGSLEACLSPQEMLDRDSRCGSFCPGRFARPCGAAGFCPLSCATGQCITPEVFDGVVNLGVDVGAVTGIGFFVQVVMLGETSGGLALTCADVEANPTAFFNDECFNVTDVRTNDPATMAGTTFFFQFSRVPSNRPMVFVVYGFRTNDTTAPPLGYSCTELNDVPAAGAQSPTQRAGNPLKVL